MKQDFEQGLREGLLVAVAEAKGLTKVAALSESDRQRVDALVKEVSEKNSDSVGQNPELSKKRKINTALGALLGAGTVGLGAAAGVALDKRFNGGMASKSIYSKLPGLLAAGTFGGAVGGYTSVKQAALEDGVDREFLEYLMKRASASKEEKNVRSTARLQTLKTSLALPVAGMAGAYLGGRAFHGVSHLASEPIVARVRSALIGTVVGGVGGSILASNYLNRHLIRHVAENQDQYKQAQLSKQAEEKNDDKPKTSPFDKGFGEGAGKGLAMAGITAAALGAYAGARSINRSMQHSKFLSAVKQAIGSSEVLAHESPSKVLSYGETIFKFAPTVASDVHLLTTMLEAAVRSGGLDYSLIKTITEIEGRHGQNVQLPKII